MKVKIGKTIYNSSETPIMIIFENDEKTLISNMEENNNKFCCFSQEIESKVIEKFMRTK